MPSSTPPPPTKMSSTFFSLTCLLAALGVVFAGKIPSFVKICHRSDPNFDDCVVESVNSLRPQLIKGIPKMGVPPLEPLYIPKLVVDSVIPNVKAKLIISDIYGKGGKDFVINKLSTDLKEMKLDAEITLPRLDVTANYKVEGSLPSSQVVRTGIFDGQFTDVLAKVKGEGETFEKDGKTYLRIKGLTADISIQGNKDIKLSPVDKNAAPMIEAAMAFFKTHRDQIFELIRPVVQQTTESYIQELGNQILKNIPLEEALPE